MNLLSQYLLLYVVALCCSICDNCCYFSLRYKTLQVTESREEAMHAMRYSSAHAARLPQLSKFAIATYG